MANLAKHNSVQRWLLPVVSLALGALSVNANAACTLDKLAELNVTMNGMTPVIGALINGNQVKFTIDSSSFYNIMSASGAAKSSLQLMPAPAWLARVPTAKPLFRSPLPTFRWAVFAPRTSSSWQAATIPARERMGC